MRHRLHRSSGNAKGFATRCGCRRSQAEGRARADDHDAGSWVGERGDRRKVSQVIAAAASAAIVALCPAFDASAGQRLLGATQDAAPPTHQHHTVVRGGARDLLPLGKVGGVGSRGARIGVHRIETFALDPEVVAARPASLVKDCRTDASGVESVYWITSRSVGESPTLWAVDARGALLATTPYKVTAKKGVGLEEVVFVSRQRKQRDENFLVLADTRNEFRNRDTLKFVEAIPPLPDPAERPAVPIAADSAGSSSVGSLPSPSPPPPSQASDPAPPPHDVAAAREILFEFPRVPADPRGKVSGGGSDLDAVPAPIDAAGGAPSISYPAEDYETAAIVAKDDVLWVFSRRKLGTSTALYRLPAETLSPYYVAGPPADAGAGPGGRAEGMGLASGGSSGGEPEVYTLEFVTEWGSGAPVAGADVSSDGRRLAVMTKERVFLFDLTQEAAASNLLHTLLGRIPMPKSVPNPVGITWEDAKTMVVLDGENGITRIELDA